MLHASYGLLTLREGEYETIQPGHACTSAPIALIGAGTGLGECYLTCDGTRYNAYPSEGGHVEFAPTDAVQIRLLEFLHRKFGSHDKIGRVSTERVVSGKGLENVYEFLSTEYKSEVRE